MLTKALIGMLDRAQSPRSVKSICRLLELKTGLTTTSVSEWYQRNGYYRIGWPSYTSHTGITVTPEKALQSGAVYAGIKVIAEDVGSMPFPLLQRTGADRKTIRAARELPLYETLHNMANPESSASTLIEALTAHALLTGNGFARIQKLPRSVYLWPWQPDDVQMDRDSRGVLFYRHRERDGRWQEYAQADVFHLPGFSLDGSVGDNILSRARNMIGLTLAAEEFAGRYFAQDATPGLVIMRPTGVPTLGPEAITLMKAAWKAWHQGLDKSHEPAVLQEGTTVESIYPDPAKTQLLELRKFQILEVCRTLRLQPSRMADFQYGIKANTEQQNREYFQLTLSPWIRRWRDAVHKCLLTSDQREDGYYAQHNVQSFMRGDFTAQAEAWRKLLEKGVYSINEIREWEDISPIPGGDEHYIQLNLSTIQAIAAGANLPNQEPQELPVKVE